MGEWLATFTIELISNLLCNAVSSYPVISLVVVSRLRREAEMKSHFRSERITELSQSLNGHTHWTIASTFVTCVTCVASHRST